LQHVERLEVANHYQERINQVAGFNRYGKSHFRLSWAQTETTRQGGEWEADGDQFQGYRDVYKGDGLPHWMLMQWVDSGKCIEMPHLLPQSDKSFYRENQCPKTGLQLLGEYPYQGSYQIALPLVAKWYEKGKLNIRAFPLSTEIIEMMVPVIKASMTITVEAKLRAMKEAKEAEDAEYTKQVDDLYRSVKRKESLASTAWLEDKQRSIEKHFNSALIARMYRDRVFQSQQRVR